MQAFDERAENEKKALREGGFNQPDEHGWTTVRSTKPAHRNLKSQEEQAAAAAKKKKNKNGGVLLNFYKNQKKNKKKQEVARSRDYQGYQGYYIHYAPRQSHYVALVGI